MHKKIEKIIKTVQHNCHIADARHAGDYTLCVYLLKMREMYRWEQGMDFSTQLTTDDVGDWLTAREGLWDDIEEEDYHPLIIDDKEYDPFDNALISTFFEQELYHKPLVYNAGLGIRCRPHFFIAELEEKIQHDDYVVYLSGKEYARDMAAPAAMAQGNQIFIRRESLRRVIWEILDDAKVNGLDNPLTRAMSYYDFDSNPQQALDDMTNAEIQSVIQHEIGEVKVGLHVGEAWNEMLASVANTQAEIMCRAIRDHLADSMTTLPYLLTHAEENQASIHFYFGNMTAMRKHLAPHLMETYKQWHETGSLARLKTELKPLQQHWQQLMDDVMTLYQTSVADSTAIETLITARKWSLEVPIC